MNFTLKYSPANPEILERYHLYDRMLHEFYDNSRDLNLERRIFFERFDYGVYNAAMRALYGIDIRDPCGDKRLFDFCYAIPIEQYIVGDAPRSLVRRAMKDRLSASTLTRTIRGQQGADWYLSMQDARPSLPAEATLIEQSPQPVACLICPACAAFSTPGPAPDWSSSTRRIPMVMRSAALCRSATFSPRKMPPRLSPQVRRRQPDRRLRDPVGCARLPGHTLYPPLLLQTDDARSATWSCRGGAPAPFAGWSLHLQIKRVGRLIQDQQLRAHQERTRQRNALPLPVRQHHSAIPDRSLDSLASS